MRKAAVRRSPRGKRTTAKNNENAQHLRGKLFLPGGWRVKTLDAMSATAAEFRKAMGCFATGVTIVTLDNQGQVHGMTANAFASVSLNPQLVLVCVDHRARTHAHLHAKKRFGINVLAADQRAISEYYARAPGDRVRSAQEGEGIFERTAHGTPVLQGALAYLECKLHTAQDAGDHTIFIAEVEDVVVREGDPLLFFRGKYRKIGDVQAAVTKGSE
jgi:flavin reductase (DIM6/NTAB) family NADH-FMN oxidoreductase RutF